MKISRLSLTYGGFLRFGAILFSCTILAISAGTQAHAAANDAPAVTSFVLSDSSRHDWSHECVTYDVKPEIFERPDLSLIGPDDRELPYQWLQRNGKKQIAFHADVPSFGKSAYRLVKGKPDTSTDIVVEESTEAIRLSNTYTGIAIRKTLGAEQGPIAGIKLASGSWIGNSSRSGMGALQKYEATVEVRGPVLTEVVCKADFADGLQWRMRFRVEAGEPVIEVTEFTARGGESLWQLQLNATFTPSHILYRQGYSPPGEPFETGFLRATPLPTADGPVFQWEPWLHWWERKQQGTWFGLYDNAQNDLLALGAIEPARWVDLKRYAANEPQAKPFVPVVRKGEVIQAEFSLTGGLRRWLIMSLDKEPSLKLTAATGDALNIAPPPQQYVIKHGDFPLDTVKDYVLQWEGDEDDHPRLFVTKEDVARNRRDFKADAGKQAYFINNPVNEANADLFIQYYLGSGDEEVGRKLGKLVLTMMQDNVDYVLLQKRKPALGYSPHHQSQIQSAMNIADAVWSTGLKPEERQLIKAQVAFIGYVVNNPNYWSTEHGFRANPNMTTMVASYQTTAGALVASHPKSKEWVQNGMSELKQQLDNWADSEGGWLEAPHYAMTSFDYLLSLFLLAHNSGQSEYLMNPKMKKIAEFFARISTPPDSRAGGLRHLPGVGNTWLNEPSGEFGIIAALFKKHDPQFSSQMQWMAKQHGMWPNPGVGGAFPAFTGYRSLILDPSLPEAKPDYGSIWFPETGVSLRNGVDDKETQLYLIAGNNHQHYDDDSGSITLWGKGRIIADDFGYGDKTTPEFHNMLETRASRGIMQVKSFSKSAACDMTRGVAGDWHRQIALVKSENMMAPNYFVLRDSTITPAPGMWRLWMDGKVTPNSSGALVEGKDDIDTDIFFVTPINQPVTAEASIASWGVGAERGYGQIKRTLTALVAPKSMKNDVFAVVYPRLKTQKPPVVSSIAEGKGVKIEHETGVDYVFQNTTPFIYDGDGIHFEGTSGCVQRRGGKVSVSLGEGGCISSGNQKAEGAVPDFIDKLKGGGDTPLRLDFEDEKVDDLQFNGMENRIVADDEPDANGKPKNHWLVFNLPQGGGRVYYMKPVFVDATQKYRFKMTVHAPQKFWLSPTGYGQDAAGKRIDPQPGVPWSYGLEFRGPSEEPKLLEGTLGPAGSGAEFVWPNNIASLNLNFMMSGDAGPVYFDDIILEPVKE